MLIPLYTKQFQRDLNKMIKRGKDISKIKQIITCLIKKQRLSKIFKDHKLIGNFKDRRECHIESDWILMYKINNSEIIFERTGNHSDLFE